MKNILINSILALTMAFLVTTLIHEFGHFFLYLCFGAKPVLYSNYVYTPDQQFSLAVRVTSVLAGPGFGLLQGLVFATVVSKNKNNTAPEQLFLWLSLLGFVNFWGYLMMTPLSASSC